METIITNSNGEALTSRYAIRDYSKLKIQECETLWNYKLNEETQTVELEENQIKDITFQNELKKGQVRVIKVDKDNNEVRLAGVEFKIYDEDNNLVDTIITNEQGETVSKKLRIDKKYTVAESKTLSNYVLTEETQTITLEEDQIKDIIFENELKKGQVRVIKIDKDNNEVRLAGVEFKIYDEDNNLVDTIITNEQGEAVSKRLRIDKKYTVVESKTLSNYVLTEETQTITLEENQITDITFENEKIKGYIQVTKTSSEDNKYSELPKGSPLPDITFEIYDLEDNLVDTITTDETGKAITKELLKGCYKIKEISSGKYYLLNNNVYDAEIVNDQEIVNVDITNDNVEIKVEVQKNGFIETQSKDDIFYNFKNIKNNSNVPLDTFTWSDHLPTDAVRINRLYTGTWNEDLEYDVYYKTNKSEEYILFKENLNTQTIYELNFKELQLQEDEYVTDYEFRFGKVKIGFQEIESPMLYCDILEGLGNGYVFTNKTKVKGTYFEKEVEDNDDWTTITYFKEINIEEVLPRTRFLESNSKL
ncbi:MAG: collagen binding domain-containing protein [Bacilli bacterium]